MLNQPPRKYDTLYINQITLDVCLGHQPNLARLMSMSATLCNVTAALSQFGHNRYDHTLRDISRLDKITQECLRPTTTLSQMYSTPNLLKVRFVPPAQVDQQTNEEEPLFKGIVIESDITLYGHGNTNGLAILYGDIEILVQTILRLTNLESLTRKQGGESYLHVYDGNLPLFMPVFSPNPYPPQA